MFRNPSVERVVPVAALRHSGRFNSDLDLAIKYKKNKALPLYGDSNNEISTVNNNVLSRRN